MAKIRTPFVVIAFLLLIALIVNYFFSEERLGGGYTYDDNTRAIYGNKLQQIDIPHEVVAHAHNRRYIVAKQYLHLGMLDTTWFNVAGRSFDGDDKFYYWIIDKKCDSVYGPMDSIQFVSFCSKNKNIPLLQ